MHTHTHTHTGQPYTHTHTGQPYTHTHAHTGNAVDTCTPAHIHLTPHSLDTCTHTHTHTGHAHKCTGTGHTHTHGALVFWVYSVAVPANVTYYF